MKTMLKENTQLELKERMSNSVLKTISAYANFGDGKIMIGIKDDGSVIGVDDVKTVRLSIEHTINDSISPRPEYSIHEVLLEEKPVVEINVRRGRNVPYLYKGSAYRRMDTSTSEIQEAELFDLMLQKRNLTYDALESKQQALTFTTLERLLHEKLGITQTDQNVLISLGLFKDGKFNTAAELLSEDNDLGNTALDIIRFGETTSIFLDRIRLEKGSVLVQYQKALDLYDQYYKPVQVIEGMERITKIRIPESAYREAVANAIIHRDYLAAGNIQIAMFQDRITVSSPGGLPQGITRENYLNDLVSVPRNPILAGVFFRLGIIELFGTGIVRIKDAYADYAVKPFFKIDQTRIEVTLPVIPIDGILSDSEKILSELAMHRVLSRSRAEQLTGKSKAQVIALLDQLIQAKKIVRIGSGPATRYQLKD